MIFVREAIRPSDHMSSCAGYVATGSISTSFVFPFLLSRLQEQLMLSVGQHEGR